MSLKPARLVDSESRADRTTRERSVHDVMAEVSSSRTVLQDFTPLHRSLEWEIGQAYWNTRGSAAFIGGDVPYVINNDGRASTAAAEVLLAALSSRPTNGERAAVNVLEYGVGSGLFARMFLEAFTRLSRERGASAHFRVRYYATDRSPRMLQDIQASKLLDGFDADVEFRVLDAGDPAALDALASEMGPNGFDLICCNYLLDVLPMSLLAVDDAAGTLRDLHVRTSLARGIDVKEFTRLSVDDVKSIASGDSASPSRKTLVDLYPLFALDYRYESVPNDEVPFADVVVDHAKRRGLKRVLHNHAAMTCLRSSIANLLRRDGIILINDYVQNRPSAAAVDENRDSEPTHQRFGGSTASALNLDLLGDYFATQMDVAWIAPEADSDSISTRLIARTPLAATVVAAFRSHFGRDALRAFAGPFEEARTLALSGRSEAALTVYGEVIEQYPHNWSVLGEASSFLLRKLRDYPGSEILAKRAIELNPISPELWNTLGDAQFYLGRIDEAHHAFERASELSPTDARSRYNQIFTLVARNDLPAALLKIGEALAIDETGEFRQRLVEKQAEILDRMKSRCAAKSAMMINRSTWAGSSSLERFESADDREA